MQSRYASLEITARVEDLGEAEDDTLLKIYDSSRNLKCTSRQSVVISCPGETFPDHKMYISITNSPPVAVNYTLEIKYNPCTTSTHVNPLRRIRLFELPWEPITHLSPIDAIKEIIHRTDLTASVNDLGPEEKIAAASCLIQIAKLAQQVGQNDKAEAILTKPVDIADMAKQIGIKQDALKGLEKIYIKRGDTSKLKEIRNQLNKITVIPR